MWVQTGIVPRSSLLQAALSVIVMAAALLVAFSAARAQEGPEIFTPDQFADEIPRGETVRSRQRPEVDAAGIRAVGFLFYPSLRQGFEYNDNIFATQNDTKSDFIYSIGPKIAARSDWNRHRLNIDAGGNFGFYIDNSKQNYEDFYARLAGLVEITHRNAIRGKLSAARLHQERNDPEDVGGIEPTRYTQYDAALQYVHRFNRLSVVGGGTIRRLDFDDVDAVGGGTINNDDRDRMVYRPGVRIAYEFMQNVTAFVRGEGVITQYDIGCCDDNVFERDAQGFDVAAGASIDITGLLFGDVFAGYRERYFDDPRFKTLTGTVFGAALTWVPTRLTTVTLKVDNEVKQSVTINASSYTSSGVSVRVDHELLRNLILSANGSYRLDDYEGIARKEDNIGAGVSVDYLMNRNIKVGGRYAFNYRDSNLATGDYTQNSVLLVLTLQM